MLRPTKHSHPDKTIINVSLIIISRLKTVRIDRYDNLLNHIKKSVSGGDCLFLPALNFLYLMGTIEYRAKIDSFEYVVSEK